MKCSSCDSFYPKTFDSFLCMQVKKVLSDKEGCCEYWKEKFHHTEIDPLADYETPITKDEVPITSPITRPGELF